MAYLHQLPLLQAIKRLHMLGGTDRKPTKGPSDALGSSLGMLAAKSMKSKPKPQVQPLAQPVAEEPMPVHQETFDEMGRNDNMKRMTFAREGLAMEGRRQPVDPIQQAIDNIKVNDAAEQTRIGGQNSPGQLQKIDNDATANAIDNIRLKQMMAPRQMQPMPLPTGMPNLRRY